jgi:hypothetical protein
MAGFVVRFLSLSITAAVLVGCAAPKKPPAAPVAVAPRQNVETYVPYVPATQPTPPAAPVEELPKSPRDPQPSPSLFYSVELWELLLPRDTITVDDAFWKRVNEQVVDLTTHDQLDKNGIRIGALPMSDLNYLTALVEERKGKKTSVNGAAGKQIELPIKADIERQTLIFLDRENYPIGKSYDRCTNVLYFSFEPAPRRPNQIRLALTPAVRVQNRRLAYSIVPGRPDRELKYTSEESHYEANMVLDLPLSSILVVAPSLEARFSSTLGHAFFLAETPSQRLERVLVVIPRAYQKADEATAAK